MKKWQGLSLLRPEKGGFTDFVNTSQWTYKFYVDSAAWRDIIFRQFFKSADRSKHPVFNQRRMLGFFILRKGIT